MSGWAPFRTVSTSLLYFIRLFALWSLCPVCEFSLFVLLFVSMLFHVAVIPFAFVRVVVVVSVSLHIVLLFLCCCLFRCCIMLLWFFLLLPFVLFLHSSLHIVILFSFCCLILCCHVAAILPVTSVRVVVLAFFFFFRCSDQDSPSRRADWPRLARPRTVSPSNHLPRPLLRTRRNAEEDQLCRQKHTTAYVIQTRLLGFSFLLFHILLC